MIENIIERKPVMINEIKNEIDSTLVWFTGYVSYAIKLIVKFYY